MDVTDISGMTAATVPDYFVMIDYAATPSSLAYFTMPLDGFVLSWNLAIQQASDTGAGVVEDIPTAEAWLEANKPPYVYKDGVYYAADETHGYIVRVVIENGYIVDVVFDAITAVNTRILWHDNGTPDNPEDDYPTVEIVSMTTKQALRDELVLVSGVSWHLQEKLLRDAIIDKQTWVADWAFVELGGHEYFDFSDPLTVDAVAGVTMAMEGFRTTFEEAIQKAIQD